MNASGAPILDLLSRLLSVELDAQGAAGILSSPVAGVLESLESGCLEELERVARDDESRRELDAEFCRLFLLGGRAAAVPALGRWLGEDDDIGGDKAAEFTVEWRGKLGLQPEDGPWGRLPDDHIAAYLALRSSAGEACDSDPRTERFDTAVARFGRHVAGESESPIYRALGKLTELSLSTPED